MEDAGGGLGSGHVRKARIPLGAALDHWDEESERAPFDPLTDLGALWTASDPEGLWRALVVHTGWRSTTHHWEAVELFRHHHEDGSPGALTTVLLLCTDRRWDRCTARLIAGITDTSILGEEDLGELAGAFLWSEHIRFECPVSWFGTDWIEIELDGGKAVKRSGVHVDPDTPVPCKRWIEPPLRRWAASRVLRAKPAAFDAVRDRALELRGPHAGAVVAGILDAVEALDEDATRQAIELGLGWPQGSVRILALELLAARDLEAARKRAASDPDRKVRRWTPRAPDAKATLFQE